MRSCKALLLFCLLLSMLVSCTAKPASSDTPSEPLGTLPPAKTTESTPAETTAQTTEETTVPPDPNAPSTYALTYLNKAHPPITSPAVESLQWRNGDGTKRYFTIVSRIYNDGNEPIVVGQPDIFVEAGNKRGGLVKRTTPYYLMPYQTGFVVVQSEIDAETNVKLEKVKYTYDIPTKEAQTEPVLYEVESATASAEHRRSLITGIDFHIIMRDPPETRFVQVNVVLYNKDGIAVDAFSQKITQRDGKIKITHYPDMSVGIDDVASFSVSLTSQCNETVVNNTPSGDSPWQHN